MTSLEQKREDVRTTVHFVRPRDVVWLISHFATLEADPEGAEGKKWVVPEWLDLMYRTVRTVD